MFTLLPVELELFSNKSFDSPSLPFFCIQRQHLGSMSWSRVPSVALSAMRVTANMREQSSPLDVETPLFGAAPLECIVTHFALFRLLLLCPPVLTGLDLSFSEI